MAARAVAQQAVEPGTQPALKKMQPAAQAPPALLLTAPLAFGKAMILTKAPPLLVVQSMAPLLLVLLLPASEAMEMTVGLGVLGSEAFQ